MSGVDPVAATGFANGAAAYASGRPGYPDAVLAWLGEALRAPVVSFPYVTKAYHCYRID